MFAHEASSVRFSLLSPREMGLWPPSCKKLSSRSPQTEPNEKKLLSLEHSKAFVFPSTSKKEKEKVVELPGLLYPELECIEITDEETNRIVSRSRKDWISPAIKPFNTFIEGTKPKRDFKKEKQVRKTLLKNGYTEKLENNLARNKMTSWHVHPEANSKYKSKRSDSESFKSLGQKNGKESQKQFAYSSHLKLRANELLKSKTKIKASEGLKNIQNILNNRQHLNPQSTKKLREIGALKYKEKPKKKDPHCISIEGLHSHVSLSGPFRDSIVGESRPSLSKFDVETANDLYLATEPAMIKRTSKSPGEKRKGAFGKHASGKRPPVIVSPKAQPEEDSYANGLMKKIQLKIDSEKLNPYPTIKLYDRKYDIASFVNCIGNKGENIAATSRKKSSFVNPKELYKDEKKNTSKGKKGGAPVGFQVADAGAKGPNLTNSKKEENKNIEAPFQKIQLKVTGAAFQTQEELKVTRSPASGRDKKPVRIPLSPKKQSGPKPPPTPSHKAEPAEKKEANLAMRPRTTSKLKKSNEQSEKEEKEKKQEKTSLGVSEKKTNLPSKSSNGNESHEAKKEQGPRDEEMSSVQKMLAFFDREHQPFEKKDELQKKLDTMRAFKVGARHQNPPVYSHSTSHIDSKSNNQLRKPPNNLKENKIESTIENFLITGVIGSGSYGLVNLAIDSKTGQKFAIKTYNKEKLLDQQKMKNVKREIENLQFLSHPFLIKLIKVIKTTKSIHLVMELISTQTLESYCQKVGGTIDETQVRFFALKIAQGLAYMHSKSVVHRDIKLENVIVDDFLNLRIIDFGFSFKIASQTKLNVYCGTPCYMAPEIVKRKPYNAFPADVWAFGIILYRVTQGFFPFVGAGATDEELFTKIMSGKYAAPKNVSTELADLIKRLFQVDPSSRLTANQVAFLFFWVSLLLVSLQTDS